MYDSSMKHKWDNKNVMDYAIKEAEHKKALDIAFEMKKDGIPNVQIAKFTKLSIEEIEKL